MQIESIRIHQLHIPFKMELTHAMAARAFSDSMVVEVQTAKASGYGEAVSRDYVSGRLTGQDSPQARLEAAAAIVGRLSAPLRGRSLSWPEIRAGLEAADARPLELPLLCGLEGAIMDAACHEEETDVYGLLGLSPARGEMKCAMGVPFVTPRTADGIFRILKPFNPQDLLVKVGADAAYSDAVLGMARRVFGTEQNIYVDANTSWSWETAVSHIPVLMKHGVRVIEEPFGRGREENRRFARETSGDFALVADESALTPQDVERLAPEGAFTMVNVRLSKNGGLLRVLEMAKAARLAGLSFKLGCHVGETGILSAEGRVAASLLPDAVYLEGSYDRLILSDNVTEENLTLEPNCSVKAIMGRRIGHTVSRESLERLSRASVEC